MFVNLSPLKEKIITASLCIIGVSAVVYGMTRKNNPVFIIGMVFIVAGYIMIRRKLKESLKDNDDTPLQ